jgi:hypothetical protein
LDTSKFMKDYYFTSLEDKQSLLVVTHRYLLSIQNKTFSWALVKLKFYFKDTYF